MSDSDTYRSLAAKAHAEIKVRGSRFIAVAMPVRAEAEAEAAIWRIRKANYDATHHGTSYRLGPDGLLYADAPRDTATAVPLQGRLSGSEP
jgi:putative IMPACT (imprinted ancient) family translation regulator